jgi:alkanesulfonate monooxygenase SsuD/methylene tetrahydromethanopterin reductase-like flavin-dependent oxidoreductase (luciferase family)
MLAAAGRLGPDRASPWARRHEEGDIVRFGILLTNQHPPDAPIVERFADAIEQVRLARDLGFDALVFGQHFLMNEFQAPQPAVAAARLAAEAGRMRIGITIYLLPLLNPVAVAEEAASFDVITGGRFIFGIGLGYRDEEDRAFGLHPGERVPRLRAHLDVIKKLWAGEPVDFESPYCRLRQATTALRPVQRPRPPIWVAANNDRAVARAAEIGDTWIINPHATLATIRRQLGLYRAALAGEHKPFPAELPMLREICVADSREAALRLARPSLERKYQAYVAWGQHRALPGDDDMTQTFDELLRDRFILGDPAQCADELQCYVDETGTNTMIFRVNWPGMPQADIIRGMRLLGEQVRPRISARP